MSNKPSTIDVIKGDQFGYDVPIGGPAAPYRQELTEAELQKAAEKKADLISKLQHGVWMVEFDKVDGSPSTMECTLDGRYLPPAADPKGHSRVVKPDLLHVYALDRVGWRSFKVLNVTRFYQKVDSL